MGFKRASLFVGLVASSVFAQEAKPSTPAVSVSTAAPVDRWREAGTVPFYPGEDLRFVVKWGVIVGGYSSLTVPDVEIVDGRPAYHILSEARSSGVVDTLYKVRDRNESWIDAKSLATVRYQKTIREGKYVVDETGVLDQVLGRYVVKVFRKDKNRTEDREGEIPPNTLDILGSLYLVRTLPLEVGRSFTIDVFSGKKVYPLLVVVKKRQKVKVPAGSFHCFLVEPHLREPGIFISKGKKLEVWITDDAYRTPVKMRSEVAIGHVSAELTTFTRGDPDRAP